MLPGFRFLSVAIVLAVSMVIFGLGAAALLRATHEEFASQPLKQMPEVTFGSREETQQPTLAVLQVDTPAAGPALEQTETSHPPTAAPDAPPESTGAAPPAADTPSAATDTTTSAASPASSDSVTPPAANLPSAEAAVETPSEPSRVETSVEAGDAVKPDIAETDAAKSEAPKSETAASDVAETMTSPFGAHFKPPLPVHRPTQIAQAPDPAPPAAKRSAAKATGAKRAHRGHVVQRPQMRPAAPSPALQPASPFALE
ncbi:MULTISPECIES: hypothetical protein [unclassified Nitrobacter]|uniref:hypothetical protein n=1 Tax=unclassified Nitrobacter TaxID=2620411 RepID=UPI00092C2DAC|nr:MULTISPECIES: hypothetical protein [unclassified Nitrobacter]MBN9148044.1 hypothetical protein [Nitrobacter sp.]OJV03894.1 MAG: hypothetical protein BGO16_05730 [Nitrobacter sp. 62-23]